jgi:hypothetical protein
MNDEFAARLRRLGASSEFVDHALSTPAASLWSPPPELLVKNGIVTAVASDDFSPSGEPLSEYDAAMWKSSETTADFVRATRIE